MYVDQKIYIPIPIPIPRPRLPLKKNRPTQKEISTRNIKNRKICRNLPIYSGKICRNLPIYSGKKLRTNIKWKKLLTNIKWKKTTYQHIGEKNYLPIYI